MADVTVILTGDEALVLSDLLHRWEDAGQVGPVLHSGEQVALWAISAALERVLVEPFDSRYSELVRAARARLTGPEER